MKLNIKNARRLETSIDEQISRLTNKIQSDNSTYCTAESALQNTKERLSTKLDKLEALAKVRMHIRNAIGKFNVVEGINAVTADIAKAVHDLSLYEMLSDLNSPRATKSYTTEEVRYSSGIDEETREAYYAETLKLKRLIQRLKDKCQGINSQGTIELSDETQSFLKTTGLID